MLWYQLLSGGSHTSEIEVLLTLPEGLSPPPTGQISPSNIANGSYDEHLDLRVEIGFLELRDFV